MSPGRHREHEPTQRLERRVDERILDSVRARALATGGRLDAVELAGAVHDSGETLGASGAAESLRALHDEVSGLSVLERFARQPGVTDVLVDGHGQVWVDSSVGLQNTGYSFPGPDEVRSLAVHLATMAGRRLDASAPFVDVSLKNYRVHAVLPPIATEGPLISVRVKERRHRPLAELLGPQAEYWEPVLRAIVERELNFLITGGTGSGKTTLLQAMLGLVDPQQRVVVVEDSQELAIDHPHVVGLQTRGANVENEGRIELQQLVVQALRMRPNRLVVGECRGAEIRDFLSAMNTGHQGAAGTLHANNPDAVPARLAALGAVAGWTLQATALQAASALDLIIHVSRGHDGRRSPVALASISVDASARMRVQRLIDLQTPTPVLDRSAVADKLGAAAAAALPAELRGE
ncbi:TadA family conjugal transfer-associated ATPase [Glutamicibacter endophyticus]|uniref:TadA family conjugal transfer-associated ATPase n=1 Tax=Glutamicibacter endophyticus TaxID=1522174 RepID=UPI003AF1CDD8